MFLRRLELQDLRSYEHAVLELGPGVTVLVGSNAQGKTNLIEAIHRAATGGSHRVAGDGPLVRAGKESGYIRCELRTDDDRRRTIEIELSPGRRTRTKVDGQDVRRAADATGVLRVVLFAPEDLSIVRGDPRERRNFLDDLLAQRRPAFAAARSEYERVLRQRNQLLKQLRGLRGGAADAAAGTLGTWTDQLVGHGSNLIAARIAAVHALAGPIDTFYRRLADRPEPIRLTYESSIGVDVVGDSAEGIPDREPIEAAFRAALEDVASDERGRGLSLVGPHRDELELVIGRLPARGYASHGETWSLALALKLATYEVLAEVGDKPIVLLDDVFAELDTIRRARLAEACDRWEQVIVSAAVEADVPLAGARVDVVIESGVSSLSTRKIAAPAAPNSENKIAAVQDGPISAAPADVRTDIDGNDTDSVAEAPREPSPGPQAEPDGVDELAWGSDD